MVTISNTTSRFNRCLLFPGNVMFFWNEPANATSTILQGALTYNGTGWGGIAFASTPQVMAQSNALIVASNPGSPNGAYDALSMCVCMRM